MHVMGGMSFWRLKACNKWQSSSAITEEYSHGCLTSHVNILKRWWKDMQGWELHKKPRIWTNLLRFYWSIWIHSGLWLRSWESFMMLKEVYFPLIQSVRIRSNYSFQVNTKFWSIYIIFLLGSKKIPFLLLVLLPCIVCPRRYPFG